MTFMLLVLVSKKKCGFVDYEKYYPKNKKEIPKGNNQKAEAKGM